MASGDLLKKSFKSVPLMLINVDVVLIDNNLNIIIKFFFFFIGGRPVRPVRPVIPKGKYVNKSSCRCQW